MPLMVSNSTSPLAILAWTIMGIVSAFSLLGNGFITVVYIHQWLQDRKLLACNCLLTSLSSSRFMTQLLTISYFSVHDICFHYMYYYIDIVFSVTWTFFNMTSLWSATWLSVFYCVKVTNFANCLFLWLKSRINVLVPRLLGVSIIISVIFSFPLIVESIGHNHWGNLTGTSPGNIYCSEHYNKIDIVLLPLKITYTCINFSISITASTLLLTSLWKHTKNLKKSGVGRKDLSTQVHINVMVPVLFYIFIYLIYLSSAIFYAVDILNPGSTEMLVYEILLTTFPSAHSIILILTNPKLKERAIRILNIKQRAP